MKHGQKPVHQQINNQLQTNLPPTFTGKIQRDVSLTISAQSLKQEQGAALQIEWEISLYQLALLFKTTTLHGHQNQHTNRK